MKEEFGKKDGENKKRKRGRGGGIGECIKMFDVRAGEARKKTPRTSLQRKKKLNYPMKQTSNLLYGAPRCI